MKKLSKISFGVGDRFGHQGEAQLKAIIKAHELGYDISPVWNKSNREHMTIGTHPDDVRTEADASVKALGWDKLYFVDADHINLDTVDRFLAPSDFFTIDVAGYIGKPAKEADVDAFLTSCEKYTGKVIIKGISEPFEVSQENIKDVADQYLYAAQKAGEIFKVIEGNNGKGNFITEVSMDEVQKPQTPIELFFILKMLADQNIPVQTIAPKFSGRFNKGVDYTGNPLEFAKEFEQDLLVLDQAVNDFNLPAEIKLSVHSGSDKFSIYPHIGRIIKTLDKGIHVKTAGTTWLEEVIGLSMAGGEALQFIKDLYGKALEKTDELCAPYADVIDIKTSELPSKEEVSTWTSDRMANAIRHIPDHPEYNPNMRQLVHVAYKLAAIQSDVYLPLLKKHSDIIGQCVYENIYDRHLKRLLDLD